MKRWLWLLLLIPSLAFAENLTLQNSTTILWTNTTFNLTGAVQNAKHTHTVSNITDFPTITNESTTVSDTSSLNLTLSGVDISGLVIGLGITQLNADNLSTGTIPDGRIASGITRDIEWDTAAEINAATTDYDFVINETDPLALKIAGTDNI